MSSGAVSVRGQQFREILRWTLVIAASVSALCSVLGRARLPQYALTLPPFAALALLSSFAMPLHVYDAAATAAHLARLEPELSYLLDELEIPEDVQANLSAREIKKMGVFAKVEASEDSFREWLKADLGLDPVESIAARVTVAKLSEAWEASRQRASTTRKLEAEARVTGQTREMLKGTHLALRRACARTRERGGQALSGKSVP